MEPSPEALRDIQQWNEKFIHWALLSAVPEKEEPSAPELALLGEPDLRNAAQSLVDFLLRESVTPHRAAFAIAHAYGIVVAQMVEHYLDKKS